MKGILSYKFRNKNFKEEAFTHISFIDKELFSKCLEYIDDSMLKLLIIQEQYFQHSNLPPWALTQHMAANLDIKKLVWVAFKHNLHRYMCHKKPHFEEQIKRFSKDILEYPLNSDGFIEIPKTLWYDSSKVRFGF